MPEESLTAHQDAFAGLQLIAYLEASEAQTHSSRGRSAQAAIRKPRDLQLMQASCRLPLTRVTRCKGESARRLARDSTGFKSLYPHPLLDVNPAQS